MRAATVQALEIRHEIDPLFQGEKICIAWHDRQTVLARVAGFRDDDRVRVQDGLGQVFGRCSGPIPVRSGPDCRSVALPEQEMIQASFQ